jgi:hypothetical protein
MVWDAQYEISGLRIALDMVSGTILVMRNDGDYCGVTCRI